MQKEEHKKKQQKAKAEAKKVPKKLDAKKMAKKAAPKKLASFLLAGNEFENAFNSIASIVNEYADLEVGKARLSQVKDPKYEDYATRKAFMESKIAAKDVCSICLDKYMHTVDFTVLKCGHCYHENCIMKWLSSNDLCPMCRSYVK